MNKRIVKKVALLGFTLLSVFGTQWVHSVVNAWGPTTHTVLSGDYNGDGKVDIYLKAKPRTETIPIPYNININIDLVINLRDVVLVADGVGGYSIVYDPSAQALSKVNWTASQRTLDFVDFNNDGNNDVLIKSTAAGGTHVIIYAVAQSQQPTIASTLVNAAATTPSGNGGPENLTARGTAAQPTTTAAGVSVRGNFSVSANGKANYEIPLTVTPSIAGIAPPLSLVYSGENGNSEVGVGWHVSGVSKITRCGTSLVQDTYINGVNFNRSDKFCLNGQRLLAVVGTYGASNTIYRTENESFTEVVSRGTGPDYFIVRRVTGEIEEYGNIDATSKSRKLTSDGLKTVAWGINKRSDREGNNATFIYQRNNATGEHVVKEILFNGNKVVFVYQARTDVTKLYNNSVVSSFPNRLEKIQMYAGTSIAREYTLRYGSGNATKTSRLVGIKECVGTVCTTETIFDWDLGNEQTIFTAGSTASDSTSYPAGATYDSQQYHVGDINGDGRSDYVWTYRELNNIGIVPYIANATGTGFTRQTKLVESGYSASLIAATDSSLSMGDVNGDGKTDIVWAARFQNDLYRVIYLANAAGTGFVSQGYEVDAYTDLSGYENGRANLADVNGDGRADLVWLYTNYDTVATTVYLARTDSTGKIALGKTSSTVDTTLTPSYYTDHDYLLGDVNGDGKSDVVWSFGYLDSIYRAVYFSNSNGTGFEQMSMQVDTRNTSSNNIQYVLGDVNGDGKSDFIYTDRVGSSFSVKTYLATAAGTSHSRTSSATPAENATLHKSTKFRLADLNGDGRGDLIYTYNSGSSAGWKVFLANMAGEGFSKTNQSQTLNSNLTHQNHAYHLADVNADGKTDLLWTYNTSLHRLDRTLLTLPKSYPDHIGVITDGLGLKHKIIYNYLASSPTGTGGYFNKSTASVYPVRDDLGLSYVVTHTESSDGIGGLRTFDYKYAGAKTHLTGRGFLGFAQKQVTDNQKNFVTTEKYWQQWPLIGLDQSTEVSKASGSAIEKEYKHWKQTTTAKNTVFRYLKDSAVLKYDLGSGAIVSASVTDNTYDLLHGTVTNSVFTTGSSFTGTYTPNGSFTATNIGGVELTTVTVSDFLNDTSANWRLGYLSSRTATYTAAGQAPKVVKSSYTPMSTSSFLNKTESHFEGSTVNLSKTFGRDSHGNITSTAVSGNNIVTRNSSTTLYVDGMYPQDLSNALNQKEVFTYNKSLGLLEKHTDYNNLITDTKYDGFGRLVLTKGKDGTETKTVFSSCTSCPAKGVYKAVTTTTHPGSTNAGAPQVTEVFDKFHRLLRSERKHFSTGNVRVDTVYDRFGYVDKTSEPYISGAIPWIDKTTDLLGRVTDELRPDGSQITTVYSKGGSAVTLETTTTRVVVPAVGTKSIVNKISRNAIGQIDSVIGGNNTATTTYTYDSLGYLSGTTTAGVSFSIESDVAGNRTMLTDPDVGIINYDYDAAGNLLLVSQPGVSQTTTYDALNRIKTRTDKVAAVTESSSVWTYDTAVNGNGLVASITGPNFSKVFHYDGYSRNKRQDVKLLGETAAKSFHYRYDPYSRISSTEYPNGYKTSTHYNANGYKSEIKNASTLASIWLAKSADARANITEVTLGNGLTTSRQYNPNNGFLQYIKTGVGINSTTIQGLDYAFDTAGNLASRQSRSGHFPGENIIEKFTYDDFHRLKTANTTGLSGGNRNLTYDYDSLGNITYKSDVSNVGGYAYGGNNGGPHAVSSVTLGAVSKQYAYDGRGNMTTSAGRTIGYTVFNKPKSISKTGVQTDFKYGPERSRIHQLTTNNGRSTETRYYQPGVYEEITDGGVLRKKSYVEDILVHSSIDIPSSGVSGEETRYLHRDNIGSVESITDAAGNYVTRMAFAPFGSRRDENLKEPSAGYTAAVPDLSFNNTARGFTGHEHLDASGLIHMNGRVYDPEIGRFLSPDTYVQLPEYSQSFNRYSYVLNNPLSYTDPSGEFIPLLVYGAVFAWRAYSAYDTVTSGAENVGILLDNNRSSGEKALAALDLASSVTGTKSIKRAVDFISGKAKKFTNRMSRKNGNENAGKKVESNKSSDAKGSDANTQTKEKSPCGCFAAGTLVLTEDGYRPIEEIKLGDRVSAMSDVTNDIAWKAIEKIYRYNNRELYQLELLGTDNKLLALTVTDDHPFWVNGRGWVKTADLIIGETVLNQDGLDYIVADWVSLGKTDTTYNFEVADYHTYFVSTDNIWVHNGGPCDVGAKKGTGGEGYRVNDSGTHRELSPNSNRAPGNSTSSADGRVQSHHPVQQKWAEENIPGYNGADAPTILLNTGKGDPHAIINGLQRRSGNGAGNSLRQELSRGHSQMIEAGVDSKAARKSIKKNYKYFVEKLGAMLD